MRCAEPTRWTERAIFDEFPDTSSGRRSVQTWQLRICKSLTKKILTGTRNHHKQNKERNDVSDSEFSKKIKKQIVQMT
jgi:hypothetical protein